MSASDYKDGRWQADQFGKQPIRDVKAALKYLEKHDISKYNIGSVATGKFASMVAGMMAGKKSKYKVDDFLPFDTKALKKEEGVTDASLVVLRRLLKTQKIDGRVIALLADEMKGFAGRNQEQ